MTNRPSDPARSSPEGRAILDYLAAQDQRHRAWGQRLDQQQRLLDEQLDRERLAREQAPADVPSETSEPATPAPDARQAIPPLVGGLVPGTCRGPRSVSS